ncbi:hypothetical protein [Mesorhizobium sp.]|jgi:hypothetical protein|uniref:hypothetical protein n=1 Tax=Mesorhizobium sp. TaxID=1871066 RepID=UPI000FE2D952|nr:hypothetical protein [Mesorhizobium sp.]RWH72849.1 MAG: hypothetical protein EOQ84_11540 [Mesorhizobium sp.]RWL34265.1 MAG: hypothetical protein EOR58_00465 [Mesorhizobium sp.]RWL35681.1 MAG: hypothetical protein EOR63_03045 [Mesorhizobium sp.]RWL41091.1 MAG: hypothetical protein EOR59_00470 [Mesorhizobium sp.]RWL53180.1 MAG: hypothetical protein EOR62_15770 [Mesorhizobium sp.]
MTSYRVTFFKNLVNSNGHQFKCPQGTVEIRRARNLDRAFQAAERRYERAKKICNWTLYADVAELETAEDSGNSLRLVEPSSHEHFTPNPCGRRGSAHIGHAISHN